MCSRRWRRFYMRLVLFQHRGTEGIYSRADGADCFLGRRSGATSLQVDRLLLRETFRCNAFTEMKLENQE